MGREGPPDHSLKVVVPYRAIKALGFHAAFFETDGLNRMDTDLCDQVSQGARHRREQSDGRALLRFLMGRIADACWSAQKLGRWSKSL